MEGSHANKECSSEMSGGSAQKPEPLKAQRGQEGQANDGGWAGGKRACKTAVQGAGVARAVVLVLGS